MEVGKACDERDADCVDKGRDNESLVELGKVGKGLSNVIVARIGGIIGFAMLEAMNAKGKERESTYMIDL